MIVEVEIKQRILVFSFTVLIVTHGREELLMKCLDSLRPPEEIKWQLVLLSNGKALAEEVKELALSLRGDILFLHSEVQLSPGAARNLALSKVEGEWTFFLDDDAFLLPGYWEVVLNLLSDPKIDVLGGPDRPVKGMKAVSFALALALSSPLCTGTTFSRHKPQGKKLQHVDEEKLTSCNLWVRSSAAKGEIFPENYIRGEETFFLQKLQSKGVGMYYHPALKVGHHRRSKLRELLRPSFYAGYYRSRLMKEKFKKGNKIFWLPAIFVLLHFTFLLSPELFWYLVRMYLSLVLFMSLALSMKASRPLLFPLIAFLHYFIVFLYGVGFLCERFGRGKKTS